jgi:glycosyltransferase involved in cell wall biosynthesis
MTPVFSVIIPTHGRPEYLAAAVASVRQQTFTDFECIVVDDASEQPATLPDDARFRLIRRDVNGGPPAARNTGIAAATGRYLAFLDDDDAWQPRRLEVAAAAHARAPVVVCWQTTMGMDPEETSGRVLSGDVADEILDGMIPHLGATTIERTAAPLFDERYEASDDVEWWLRVAHECKVETTRYVGLLYRAHSAPRTRTGHRNRIHDASMLFDQYDEWFRAHPRAKAFRLKRMGLSAVQANDRRLAVRCFIDSLRLRPEFRTAWHALCAAVPRRQHAHG